jgi:DnaD/phage-associated family protein
MKLENADILPLFSNTLIPDIFFSEYLSEANGDFIKVYLYMLFLSKYDKDIKINDLSKKLVLPVKTIQDAVKYWEEQGLITKKNTGYIINNMQEIELHKLYKPKTALSAEQLQKSAENQQRAKAIEFINNKYFSGLMPTTWYPEIELWFKKYNFDEEVMIALFGYCFDKSALHKNYVQTVAEAWNKNNIKTFNDLDVYYEKQEKLKIIAKTIAKKLGLSRGLTQYEYAYIEKWNIDYGYGLDVIEIALKKTTSKANPNFDYLDKLLTDWHDRGFKTPNDVQAFLAEMKEKNKNIKKLEKDTGYDKYDQRSYSDLDSLYINFKK